MIGFAGMSAYPALLRKLEAAVGAVGGELVAFHLRQAVASLDAALGSDLGEDVLEEVFGSFCVGK